MATELHVGPGVALPDAVLIRVGTEWVEMPADHTPLRDVLAGWLDGPHIWSAAAIGQYCSEINMIAQQPDVIAERATRAAAQEHLSRYDELAEIAAEVHAATNDDPDPHGNLSWRNEWQLPY